LQPNLQTILRSQDKIKNRLIREGSLLEKTTYSGMDSLGWSFGTTDAAPWKWDVSIFPFPVFHWQMEAPAADLSHLN
jgi:hypothetical protein